MPGKLDQISVAIGELRAGQEHLRAQADETASVVREIAKQVTSLNGVDVKLAALGLDAGDAEHCRADFRLLRTTRTAVDWMTRRAWKMAGAGVLIWAASTYAPAAWRYIAMAGVK